MNSLICIPFDIKSMLILGEDGGPTAATTAYARSAVPVRYSTIVLQWAQTPAAAGSDFVAAVQSRNVLGGGAPPVGAGGPVADAATTTGYPASFGTLTTRETNLYPGGRPCPSGMEFVMCAYGVRPMQIFQAGVTGAGAGSLTGPDGLDGELIYAPFLKTYQSQVQQAGLDNLTFRWQRLDDTCALELTTAPHAPDPNSSGVETENAQNGAKLRYNVNPLCKCLVIRNRDGNVVDSTLTAATTRPMRMRFVAIGGDPPVEPTTLFSEFQIDMWGYCRWGCREDVLECLRGVVCRSPGRDWSLGFCGAVAPAPPPMSAPAPVPGSGGIPTPP